MKKLVKGISIMLAGIMAAACLSGCGAKDEAVSDVPTLKFYMIGEEPEDLASVMEEANKITLEKIGAKLDMTYLDDAAYKEKMEMNFASRTNFDICFVGYALPLVDAVNKGALMDITEYLENDAPELLEQMDEDVWRTVKFDGGIYAVPNMQIIAMGIDKVVRKDMADKYGLDVSAVKNMRDLIPFYEKIKENEPNVYPVMEGTVTTCDFGKMPFRETHDNMIWFDYETGKFTPMCDAEEYYQNAKLTHEFYQKGFIRADANTVTDTTADKTAGRYISYNISSKPGALVDEQRKSGYEYVNIVLQPYCRSSNSPVATTLAVSSTSEHPAEAVKLISLLNTDKDFYNLIVYGIEGKHYKKIADNRVEVIEGAGYDQKGGAWKFGNTFNAYLVDGQADNIWEETKEINETAARSPYMGFRVDKTNVTTEIAQCTKVRNEYIQRINSGVVDPDTYWEEYKNKMTEAGIHVITEEFQRQLDEFVANN